MTADDVIFSFEASRSIIRNMPAYYRHVIKAEKTGEREVTFTFDGPGNRELPQIVGQLTCCRSTGGRAPTRNGNKRDIGATTLEPPLGSGPYRDQGVHAPAAPSSTSA